MCCKLKEKEYQIFVTARDDSQWAEGWIETVTARNRAEAKAKAIANIRKAIGQPDADLIAPEE